MFQIMKLGHVYKVIIQYDTEDGIKTYEDIIKFQDGPIKENGVNGVQNENLLEILIDRIEYLQGMDGGRYACQENMDTLVCLKMALRRLKNRTDARKRRGVEGTSQV